MKRFKFSVQSDAMKEVRVVGLRVGFFAGRSCLKSSNQQLAEASDVHCGISGCRDSESALCRFQMPMRVLMLGVCVCKLGVVMGLGKEGTSCGCKWQKAGRQKHQTGALSLSSDLPFCWLTQESLESDTWTQASSKPERKKTLCFGVFVWCLFISWMGHVCVSALCM